MQHSIDSENGNIILKLSGQFTAQDRRGFDDVIKSVLIKDGASVQVELDELLYMDSVGLGMLITLRAEVEKASKSICLCNPIGDVKEALFLACFDRLFEIK
ncbi:MAG: STAS domain-containing protein [Alphaproteobacteria bacterium]|nr:STAS domain-containing protein [Alphaproteobacteria bacterium]